MSAREERNAKARATRARNKVVEPIGAVIYRLVDEIGYDYERPPRDYGSAEWLQRIRKLNTQLTERTFALEQHDAGIRPVETNDTLVKLGDAR